MERIILDTDIGTDVDDVMAVTLAAISPELKVEGITAVYGDVGLRARMIVKVLKMLGREDIPVFAGSSEVLLRNREIWWLGHEGEGLLSEDDIDLQYEKKHAVNFIIETIMNNPGEITLVGIGPFTNFAIALALEPRIAQNVKNIIIMGGSARLGANAAELEHSDHNISRDPESAALLFRSGAPIIMCGYDVTRQVLIREEHIRMLENSGKALNQRMADMIRIWLKYWKRDFTAMNDPLCVAMAYDPSLCSGPQMLVEVEYDHRHPTGHTVCSLPRTPWTPPEQLTQEPPKANVKVCLEVDSQRFIEQMMQRICNWDCSPTNINRK